MIYRAVQHFIWVKSVQTQGKDRQERKDDGRSKNERVDSDSRGLPL